MKTARRETKKVQDWKRAFVKKAEAYLLSLGVACEVRSSHGTLVVDSIKTFELLTEVGKLSVTVYDDWLACRFDEPKRAKELSLIGPGARLNQSRLNPFSGKWNFHYHPEMRLEDVLLDFKYELGLIYPVKETEQTKMPVSVKFAARFWIVPDYHEFEIWTHQLHAPPANGAFNADEWVREHIITCMTHEDLLQKLGLDLKDEQRYQVICTGTLSDHNDHIQEWEESIEFDNVQYREWPYETPWEERKTAGLVLEEPQPKHVTAEVYLLATTEHKLTPKQMTAVFKKSGAVKEGCVLTFPDKSKLVYDADNKGHVIPPPLTADKPVLVKIEPTQDFADQLANIFNNK